MEKIAITETFHAVQSLKKQMQKGYAIKSLDALKEMWQSHDFQKEIVAIALFSLPVQIKSHKVGEYTLTTFVGDFPSLIKTRINQQIATICDLDEKITSANSENDFSTEYKQLYRALTKLSEELFDYKIEEKLFDNESSATQS